MPTALLISAAVITRNRADLLVRTLPTVLNHDLPFGRFELIVVDDAASDATPALLEAHADRPDGEFLSRARRRVHQAAGAEEKEQERAHGGHHGRTPKSHACASSTTA